ncbi:hypothetical protein ABGB18_03805 [Nonomuraea sp. B12E4]|uniref:hypothetical protein n=1 Tax=Nonomuraea sp. B12E4 TaxID=3153564 RepID=UPI00325DB30A
MTEADDFVPDVTRIRDQVRQKMDEGPITQTFGHDPRKVVQVLKGLFGGRPAQGRSAGSGLLGRFRAGPARDRWCRAV